MATGTNFGKRYEVDGGAIAPEAEDRDVIDLRDGRRPAPTSRHARCEIPKPSGSEPSSKRRRTAWTAVAVTLVAVAGAAVFLLAGRDGQVVAEPVVGVPAAGTPGQPPGLRVAVEPPARVVAGEPASFIVSYRAPEGVFSGSTEDWGEGIGTSSAKLGSCDAAAQAAGPLSGRQTLSHTWSEPGTYTVKLGVNISTCQGSQPTPAEAAQTLQVHVVPR